MRDSAALQRAVEIAKPDEIYNLAAQSDVGISFTCPEETMEVNYHGLGRLLYEAMKVNPKVRIYQASTSEMFGRSKPPQSEKTDFHPVSPYGEAKLRAHLDYVGGYREQHGLYICPVFLFNPESQKREKLFVPRKITPSWKKKRRGRQKKYTILFSPYTPPR